MYSARQIWACGAALLSAAMAGCTTETLPLRYTPLSAVERLPTTQHDQRIGVLPFIDARDRHEIAHYSAIGSISWVTEDDIRLHMAGAVVDTLRKAGLEADLVLPGDHRPREEHPSPAESDALILTGRLLEYRAKFHWGRSSTAKGHVSFEYRIARGDATEVGDWRGPVTGMWSGRLTIIDTMEVPSLTDAAMQDCMRNFISHLRETKALAR